MTRTIFLAGAAALAFAAPAFAQAGASPDATTTSQPTAAAGPSRATTPPATESATDAGGAMPAEAMQADRATSAGTMPAARDKTATAPVRTADGAAPSTSAHTGQARASVAESDVGAEPRPAPTDTAAAEPATQPAEPAAPAPAQSAQAAPAAAGAGAGVQAEWASYDKGNKGSLTPLEFGKWVMAANGQDMSTQVDRTKAGRQANLPAVKVLNATASAFGKADTNGDRKITPEELTSFLQG